MVLSTSHQPDFVLNTKPVDLIPSRWFLPAALLLPLHTEQLALEDTEPLESDSKGSEIGRILVAAHTHRRACNRKITAISPTRTVWQTGTLEY